MNMMNLHGAFDAIDPFLDAVAHWQQDYLKLDDAPFSAEFTQYVSSDFHVGRVQLTGHILQMGSPIPGAISLALYDEDLSGTFIRDRELTGDAFGLADEGEQGALYFRERADMIIFTVPIAAVHDFFQKDVSPYQLHLSAENRKRVFKELVREMKDFSNQPAQNVRELCIQKVFGSMTVKETWDHTNSEWSYHHDMVLKFIGGARETTNGLSALIDELQLNRRRLTSYVQQTFGLTLVRFLKVVRMNRARRLIHEIGTEQVIAEIAQNSGLSHAGRFSREFADIFDEAPSDARDRAKNRLKT